MAGPRGAPGVAEPYVRGARGRVERGGLGEVTALPGEVSEEGARHCAPALLGRTIGGAERAEQLLGEVAPAEAVGRDPGRQPSGGPGIGIGPFVGDGCDELDQRHLGLGEDATGVAEPGERRGEPDDPLALVGCPGMHQGDLQVGVEGRKLRPGVGLGGGADRRLPLLSASREPRGVAVSGGLALGLLLELLGGVLAEAHQHREPGAAVGVLPGPAHQALVQQRLDHVEEVGLGADRRGTLEVPLPREHRQPTEGRAVALGQQVVAPGDGRPQVAVSVWRIARSAGQHAHPLTEPERELARCEHP